MFQVMDYEKELKIMENLTKEEYLASLRRYQHCPCRSTTTVKKCCASNSEIRFYLDDRKSSGFSRGVSKYRGVARYYIFEIKFSNSSIRLKVQHNAMLSGITKTEDGRQESAASSGTSIST